jgi:cytidine deaminase
VVIDEMGTFDPTALKAAARRVAGTFVCSRDCTAGGVGAAVLAASGEIFTGICVDTQCSLGFCAEHAAIAEMLKHRQTRMIAIVAVDSDGQICPPCGRCRELIRQVDAANWDTKVIVADDSIVALGSLLPFAEPAARPVGT